MHKSNENMNFLNQKREHLSGSQEEDARGRVRRAKI